MAHRETESGLAALAAGSTFPAFGKNAQHRGHSADDEDGKSEHHDRSLSIVTPAMRAAARLNKLATKTRRHEEDCASHAGRPSAGR